MGKLLLDLPSEILANILANCNLGTLFNAGQACKRLSSCIDTDIVWRQKWKQFTSVPGMQGLQVLSSACGTLNYKAMCQRFYAIFNQEQVLGEQECGKCHQVCCETSCVQDTEEMIIFDFGSKTTWFKYDSESTGQLSMHPTVAPLGDSLAGLDLSEEDLAATESCPVCARIVKRKMITPFVNDIASSTRSATSSPKTDRAAHGHRRITAAFSRLSLRSLQCFDSPSDDTLDDDAYLSGVRSADSVLDNGHMLTGRGHKVESPKLGLHHGVESPKLGLPQAGACANLSPAAVKRDWHGSTLSLIQACNNVSDTQKIELYTFLLRHMLKRNPFFQVKSIPFVICEPIGLDSYRKQCLIQYVIEELKVPGVCFIPKSIAASLYIGNDTCLVVDSGSHNTVVTPIIEQTVHSVGVQHKTLGGFHVTKRLVECIKMKGLDGSEIDETSVDSSQVKRECYLAYNPAAEAKRRLQSKPITIKGLKNGKLQHLHVDLSHELYQASEDMYLNLDLPGMIQSSITSLEPAMCRKLLSNIVLTGGNCRLAGLALRLTRDLQQAIPECANILRICDPRLMRGRTDAVIGASYVKKWEGAQWTTRKDYIVHGPVYGRQAVGRCETRFYYCDDTV